jgi:hypothetical protein
MSLRRISDFASLESPFPPLSFFSVNITPFSVNILDCQPSIQRARAHTPFHATNEGLTLPFLFSSFIGEGEVGEINE